jgi:RNA polymerase sigma-70 factor (ECF subfamily)
MGFDENRSADIHRQLIDQCRKGDSQAQFRIYKLYYKAMYSTALRIVKVSQEAEEVMQEAFLSAFEKIGEFKGEVSFGAWLKKIVINRSLDALRKKKVIFEDLEKAGTAAVTDTEAEDESRYGAADVQRIKAAMKQLPDGYRTILSLYLFEGYDHEEIAGIMGITPVTSRTQYSRARKKLKELLEKEEDHG